jgi:hypothetical protein
MWGETAEQSLRWNCLPLFQTGIEGKQSTAIRAKHLTLLTKFQIDVRMVLRWCFTNAFERPGTDANFSHPEIVAELWNSLIWGLFHQRHGGPLSGVAQGIEHFASGSAGTAWPEVAPAIFGGHGRENCWT